MKLEEALDCHSIYIAELLGQEGLSIERNGTKYLIATEMNLPFAVATIKTQRDTYFLENLILRSKNSNREFYKDLLYMVEEYAKSNNKKLVCKF